MGLTPQTIAPPPKRFPRAHSQARCTLFRDSTFAITVQLLSINHILMSISQNEVKNTFEI